MKGTGNDYASPVTAPPVPPTAYSLTPPSRVPAAAAAGLLTVGVYLYSAFTYGSDPAEGLLYVATLGLPSIAFCFIVFYGAFSLAGRLLRRRFPRLVARAIVPVCALLAAALPALGYRESRPRARFERLVLSPAPQSLRDLRVEKVNTFSDGHAWGFSFRLAPEDFALLQSRHGLRELVEQRERREKILAESGGDRSEEEKDDLFTEDSFLRRAIELYKRPPSPQFFRGGADDRILVVTDEGHTEVTVFIDQFVRPKPKR